MAYHETLQRKNKQFPSVAQLDLQQKMSRRKFGKIIGLGGIGTLFVFSKILLDKGSKLIDEKGQKPTRSGSVETNELLPNPLVNFTETDGARFMIDEEVFKRHVAQLPDGTTVTLSQRRVISPQEKTPAQQ